MSSVSVARKIPLLDCFSASPLEDIPLSGQDLETYEKIAEVVKSFCQKIDLPPSMVVLTNSPSWQNLFAYFCVPTKCFSSETRDRIIKVWVEKSPFPIPDDCQKTMKKIAEVERAIFTSMAVDEWSALIGHELGHAWLNHHLKAFYSESVRREEQKVASLKHDRAQERICDFIGAYLTSPQAAAEAMKKESANAQVDDRGDATHPSFAERIRYLSEWIDDPRLKQPLTKELVLEVGGPDFQEAAAIYEKYGR